MFLRSNCLVTFRARLYPTVTCLCSESPGLLRGLLVKPYFLYVFLFPPHKLPMRAGIFDAQEADHVTPVACDPKLDWLLFDPGRSCLPRFPYILALVISSPVTRAQRLIVMQKS